MSEMMSEAEELAITDYPHDAGGYNNHGCRGPICRAGHARAAREKRAERRAQVAKGGLPEGVEHGASAYTNWGCKCDICKDAHAAETALYRV